jgi:hypothetical protein
MGDGIFWLFFELKLLSSQIACKAQIEVKVLLHIRISGFIVIPRNPMTVPVSFTQ